MSAPILNILMNSPDLWPTVADQLQPEMFHPAHRRVFMAYRDLAVKGDKPDAILVSEALGDDSVAQDALNEITRDFDSAHSLEGHVRKLVKDWRQSQAEAIGRKLASGYPAERASEDLAALRGGVGGGISGAKLREMTHANLVEMADQDFVGLSTGISALDSVLGGLRGGQFIVLAARPRMGKTALALNIAQVQTKPVGLFSLEMSADELATRLIATKGVDYGDLNRPKRIKDWKPITAALGAIPEGLVIFDRGGQSIDQIEAEAYRLHASRGLGMVMVDYLQLITTRAESRLEVVSEISRRLKALAKNLDIPVIALSQLNRGVENRAEPRPGLQDLRESGQIEQDADKVVFIYRPSVYDRDGQDVLIVAKNRSGHAGDVPVKWHGSYQKFTDCERFF